MSAGPKADTVNLRLRIRVDLLRKLEAAAGQDHRPVQTEITRRLEASFTADQVAKMVRIAADLLDGGER
jgi:hypothetical protein